MQNLTISIIQTDLYWEDIAANLAMLEEKIWDINQPTDLIILPEMFNSGFSMNVNKLAEPVNGLSTKWLKLMAAQTNAVVTGSLIIKEGANFYNRLIWMQPDGNYQIYNKKHTFTYGGESAIFTKGTHRLIVEWKGWKICPLICYDLRFPEWSRNFTDSQPFDLLIYVANWTHTRSYAWNNMLKTRAIENSCYTVGVNILGKDGRDLEYTGDSAICNPVDTLSQYNDQKGVFTFTLDYDWLKMYRRKFPFLEDGKSVQM